MIALALILTAGAIAAPFLGLGVTGCILLGVGAALFIYSAISILQKSRKEQKEVNAALLTAAASGNAEGVKNALGIEKVCKGGKMVSRWGEAANVNVKDYEGRTPLNIAATECAKSKDNNDNYSKHLEVIGILLKNGADKNIVLFKDGTPEDGIEKVKGEIEQLAGKLQPLYKPTLADRLFKR